jgi:hypothetical protein
MSDKLKGYLMMAPLMAVVVGLFGSMAYFMGLMFMVSFVGLMTIFALAALLFGMGLDKVLP